MKASTFQPANLFSDPVYNHVQKLDLKSLQWYLVQNQRFEEVEHILAAFDTEDSALHLKVGHGNLEILSFADGSWR